ncbi:MAG: dihydrodipicolinate reductase [Desulfobacteraceae bacterium]|uniref:4-hydroxy-tetrahydrodipicolinate reductase n=1 Tax=Candidatus Desulfaltia bathyphila TaxID=2841697 RepID=A0A8J6T6K5_9BACT|nr:dihydrodipicolinate reductase [Candidatus Desulfaltia bathyphila]
MNRMKIMVNGIPGNMAVNVAKHVLDDEKFELISYSFTGPEIAETQYVIDSLSITLIQPEKRNQAITEIVDTGGFFVSVDYTHPLAVNGNAEFYCKHNLPFVMGTTGGDRKLLEDTIKKSSIPAVVAPNMAKQIVGFQAMMEYGAKSFPDLFKGYSLQVKESHQKGKADTSGTAKAMIRYFNEFGMPFNEEEIIMERDPETQKVKWGISEEYLSGHGWHTYTLISEDQTVRFEFTHNVNGRDIYAKGTLDAISYLYKRIEEGAKGRMFTMIDVLKELG